MAQGPTKSKSKSTTTTKPRTKSQSQPKKGSRTIAPKRASLVKAGKITKKYSGGLTSRTEGKLAERVGYLELLGGASRGKGKKGKNKEEGKGSGKVKEGKGTGTKG